jgi:hypothetical protein
MPERTIAQDPAVSAPSLETPRTLTFAELQTFIELGKMDEIPINKHIPDALNVGLPTIVLTSDRILIAWPLAGYSPQSVKCCSMHKSPGNSLYNQNNVRTSHN